MLMDEYRSMRGTLMRTLVATKLYKCIPYLAIVFSVISFYLYIISSDIRDKKSNIYAIYLPLRFLI